MTDPNSPTSSPVDDSQKKSDSTKQRKSNIKNDPDESKDKNNNKQPEKLTTLPVMITDEEGASIPEASNGSMYQYRDFSNVPEEELEQQPNTAPPPPPTTSRGPVESSIRVQKFPVKLYAILAQKEFQDIITWMPHGRSWKVLKPNLFESLVMPLFFEYSNYHSFNRLVNAWSFRRISSGPDRGSYYHELFLRGKPYLQKYMRRLPKTHKKLPMKKDDEPDFYAMDKANPLPSVDEAPLPPGMSASPLRPGAGPMGVPGTASPSTGPMGAMPGMDPLLSRHHMGSGMNPMGGMGMGYRPGSSMSPMNGMGMGSGMTGPMGMAGGGIGMHGMSGRIGMGGGMHGMSSMGGMMPMDGMGGMGGGMNSMAMNSMGAMSPMSGMSAFRESQYGGPGAAGDMEFQRLRQIQQMHMLDRQMGNGTMSGGLTGDPLDRMRSMEMRFGR